MEFKPFRFDSGCKKRAIKVIFIISSFWLICLLACPTAYSQPLSNSINISLTNASFEQAIKEIKKQTGYEFVYTSEQVKKSVPVTLFFTSASLKHVLDACFKEQPFTYVIEEKYIAVKDRVENSTERRQQKEINGKVTDENGNSLVGITVAVKSSGYATATDNNGHFVLQNVNERDILIVSSIGYQTLLVPVNGNDYFDIRLEVAITKMDETLIIAYGATTRRLNTGSIAKVSSKEIERQPIDNPLAAIQGRVPGVFVTTLNGLPGGNIKLEIRGRGSIAAGTDPLYIIDGVPYSSTPLNKDYVDFIAVNGEISPLNNINPNDIESIEILKDADATAIYGSRGANGVVLITTKKGKGGQTKFDFNVSHGFSKVAELPALLSASQYLELRREGFRNDGISPTVSNAPELMIWDTTKSTNWAEYMWGKIANRTSVQGTVSGGSASTNFLLSGYYRTEGTILKGNEYFTSGGGRSNIQHISDNKKFSLLLSTSYNFDYSNLILGSTLSEVGLAPDFPLYDSSGNLNWLGVSTNPVATINQRAKATNTTFISNLSLQYSLLKNLQLKVAAGYTLNELQQVNTIPKFTISPTNFRNYNSTAFGNNQNRTVIIEPQASYSRVIGKGNLDVLFGGTWQSSLLAGNLIKAINFSNENLLEFLGAAGGYEYSTSLNNQYKYASAFGRVTYSYKKRYILNATARRDGSSRFGPGKQFGNFGSLGLGWIFSNYDDIQRMLPFLSFGKFRASYGLTGNDKIPDYQFLSSYSTGSVYQGVAGFSPSVLGNPLYSWETNWKAEGAMELGFLKDRLVFNLSYYRNRSSNQLVGYSLPYQTGFSSFQANLPAVIENTGIEGELNSDIIKSKSLTLSVSFNITFPRSKLVSYPGLSSSVYATRFEVGKDLNIVKGYHFLGVDPATGLASYQDVNQDGKISQPQDFIMIGKTSPYYFGGFGQQLKYKSLNVDVFFQFVKQYSRGAEMAPGNSRNQFATVLGRWQKPGDITNIPRASAISGTPGALSYSNLVYSDAFFYNASYMRFKNISFSYSLPHALIAKMKMENVRLYINGQNFLTIRKRVNLNDPETLQGGIPPLKTVVAGIQINF
jgi:TonB-dependent starch-binding outer membrane protein SusC